MRQYVCGHARVYVEQLATQERVLGQGVVDLRLVKRAAY